MKVLNFGSLNLDYVYQVDHFVQPSETLGVSQQNIYPGGKGLNQSIALSRAGAQVYHAGCVGNGGEMLVKLLRENNVNTDYLRKVDAIQGNAVIQVAPTGENSILLFGGSNLCVTNEQVDETLAAFEAGDYLLLQNEINALPYIVEQAYERGMHIIMNAAPFSQSVFDIDLNKLQWLFVNEIEAAQLAGTDDCDAVWQYVHGRYPACSVLITLGSRGSAAYLPSGEIYQQNAFKVEAVDTTGAGDTFTGFFIGGQLKNLSVPECMELATKASSVCVTRAGAAVSIPLMEEVPA